MTLDIANVQPTGSRIMLQALSRFELADRTEGGLYLPQQAEDRQRYRQWTVVACGPDVVDEALLPGARVIVKQFAGTPIEMDGEVYAWTLEEYVVAIIED